MINMNQDKDFFQTAFETWK